MLSSTEFCNWRRIRLQKVERTKSRTLETYNLIRDSESAEKCNWPHPKRPHSDHPPTLSRSLSTFYMTGIIGLSVCLPVYVYICTSLYLQTWLLYSSIQLSFVLSFAQFICETLCL